MAEVDYESQRAVLHETSNQSSAKLNCINPSGPKWWCQGGRDKWKEADKDINYSTELLNY